MLQRGDTFGSYRIVARLKAGGMAQLHLARREGAAGFAKPVALKVIHAHLAKQAEFVRMFVDEATLSSKIHDPNVVHVEDLGSEGGTLFLAMEYVHGTSLAQLLRAARLAARRLSPSTIAYVGAQIASGLHAAHETTDETGRPLGIVHRDVSPQNVLLSFRGHVKVIDFGVAKAFGKRHATDVGEIQGKLGYMPPEQARSEPIDRRADVYALGIVLWEMIAGRRLFEAENQFALLERVRNPKIEPPGKLAPAIPHALDDVVMKMLALSPADRPATALDVKRMLLDAVSEARAVEAHDVAALLRALLPAEIEAQDKVLASIGEGPGDELAEDEETTARVDPVDALHQLTVPEAVVASPAPAASSKSGYGLAAAFAALAVALALLFFRGAEKTPPPPAPDTVTFPPPAPLPSASPVEPAPSASPSSSPAPSPPRAGKTSRPARAAKPASSASAGPKVQCELVNGVELCDQR